MLRAPVSASQAQTATFEGDSFPTVSDALRAVQVLRLALYVSLAFLFFADSAFAQITWRGDFETGNLSQWNGAQCKNTGTPDNTPPNTRRGNIFVVSDVKASGTYSARIDLPLHNTGSLPRTACEALHTRPLGTGHGSPPVEEWYAQEVRLPTNWTPGMTGFFNGGGDPGGGMAISQYAYQGIHSPGMGLEVFGNASLGRTAFRLSLNFGSCTSTGGCQGLGNHPSGGYVLVESPTPGEWYQFLIRIVRSAGNNGIVQAWVRKRGEAIFVQKMSSSGHPTVQWTPTQNAFPSWSVNDKVGAYRGGGSAAVSIWHDNFCTATTRASAESCFGLSPPPSLPPACTPPAPGAKAGGWYKPWERWRLGQRAIRPQAAPTRIQPWAWRLLRARQKCLRR